MAQAAMMKSEQDGMHPYSHYLAGDPSKPSTWGLRVKDKAGNYDRALCGAAYAALYKNYRGNQYSGPGVGAAKAKLRAIYAAQDWPWPGGGA